MDSVMSGSNFILDNIRAAATACKAGDTSNTVLSLSKALSLILESGEVECLDACAYSDIPPRLECLSEDLEDTPNPLDSDE